MSLKDLFVLATAVALGFGAACRTIGAVGTTETQADDALPQTTTTPSDSVRFWIEAPREARRGEPVPLTLKVQNLLPRPVTLVHGGLAIRFDLVVTRPDGTEVWSLSHSAGGVGIQTIRWATTIQAGQVLEVPPVWLWDQRDNDGKPVPPGTYSIHGVLVAVDRDPKTEVTPLQIRP